MSTRTFLYKPTWLDWAGMLLFLLGALASFWIKQIILGTLLVIVLLRAIDRSFHTTYTITNEQIGIRTGRIAKTIFISFANIERYEVQKLAMGAGRLIIIELKNGRTKSVVPDNIEAFCKILRKKVSLSANN